MGFSKVIYFLFGGGVLASIAILIALYQPTTIEEKDIVLKRSSELKSIKDINFVVGKILKKNIKKDHPFKKTDLL